MQANHLLLSGSFVQVRGNYQVHLWSHPDRSKGILVSADTGHGESLSTALAKALRLMTGRNRLSEVTRAFANEYDTPLSYVEPVIKKVVERFVLEDVVEIASIPMPARRFSRPFTVPYHLALLQIQVTNKCNLHCLHCYAESGKRAKTELSTKDILNLIDEFSGLGGVRVFLTGGEPLLHPDLDVIIAHAKKRHLFVYLSTNGYTLSDKRAERLVKLGIGAVNISIDGCNAETHDTFRGKNGAFKRAMNAIDIFLSKGIICASQTTVHTENLDQCVNIVNTLRPRGVNNCFFVRMMPEGRGGKHPDLIPRMDQYRISREKEYRNRRLLYGDNIYPRALKHKKWRCSAAVSQLYVQADGHCYPCPSLVREGFLFGKYPDSGLEEIWKSETGELSNIRAFDPNKIDKCRGCEHAPFCRGGCFGNALLITGDWRQPDPHHCVMMNTVKRLQKLAPITLEITHRKA